MNTLQKRLKRLIKQEGFVTLADYMTLASQSYYKKTFFFGGFCNSP